MPHLRSIAGALALALCAAACTTVEILPPKEPQPYDVAGEPPTAFGAMTQPLVNRRYVIDQASTASFDGPTVPTLWGRLICFQVVMSSSGSPVGAFAVQGSLDSTTWDALWLDEARVYGENFVDATTPYPGGFDVDVSSPAGPVNISLCVENTYPSMRLIYTRSSGGASAAVDVTTFVRP